MTILQLGDELPLLRKQVYQRSLEETVYPDDSIHNDAYAKSMGYSGALVSSFVVVGYLSEFLVGLFGEPWLSSGHYTLSFIRGVTQGAMIDCRGVVTAVDVVEGGRLMTLDVWVESGGVKLVVGQASAKLVQ